MCPRYLHAAISLVRITEQLPSQRNIRGRSFSKKEHGAQENPAAAAAIENPCPSASARASGWGGRERRASPLFQSKQVDDRASAASAPGAVGGAQPGARGGVGPPPARREEERCAAAAGVCSSPHLRRRGGGPRRRRRLLASHLPKCRVEPVLEGDGCRGRGGG